MMQVGGVAMVTLGLTYAVGVFGRWRFSPKRRVANQQGDASLKV